MQAIHILHVQAIHMRPGRGAPRASARADTAPAVNFSLNTNLALAMFLRALQEICCVDDGRNSSNQGLYLSSVLIVSCQVETKAAARSRSADGECESFESACQRMRESELRQRLSRALLLLLY